MSPRSFPVEPTFADHSEREVWNALMDQLPIDAAVICNLVILESDIRHEIDFIVAIPDVGISIVEVKGGDISPNEDSTFTQRDKHGSRNIDPITQVTRNLYQLKKFIETKSSLRHFTARPSIVFPYADIPTTYFRPDIPRRIVNDKVDLATIGDRLITDLRDQTFRPNAIEIHGIFEGSGPGNCCAKIFDGTWN